MDSNLKLNIVLSLTDVNLLFTLVENGRYEEEPMTDLDFDSDIGRIQRALAQCHDMVVRRSAILESPSLRSGEPVSEVGCDSGQALGAGASGGLRTSKTSTRFVMVSFNY
jgi:hypothetical protein